ncbi:MAG: tRNA (guanosine(46)-N7)-methyltransferase TrmB [Rickettsia sp.]|nr:tRNA (guanosine(46)-N7)-methyltransferase TrmB [Rickettsia sp.]
MIFKKMKFSHNFIKSFARRKFKQISNSKYHVLEKNKSNFFTNINLDQLLEKGKSIELEIGFGNGEYLISRMINNPDTLFLACEVFLNGIINFLNLIEKYELKNYILFQDDIYNLLPNLPNHILTEVFILFPDPWPKTRQKKRRLVNYFFLNKIIPKLSKSSLIHFISDDENYISHTEELFQDCEYFSVNKYDNPSEILKNYSPTKYHRKALTKNKKVQYLLVQFS